MNKKKIIVSIGVVFLFVSVSYFLFFGNHKDNHTTSSVELANPASVNCIKHGYKSVIENNSVGYCVNSLGQKCEEWAYYRGKCSFNNSEKCLPSGCCHASSCVLGSHKLDKCGTSMCTMECRKGTMDCGAGHCGFVDGKCKVIWNEK